MSHSPYLQLRPMRAYPSADMCRASASLPIRNSCSSAKLLAITIASSRVIAESAIYNSPVYWSRTAFGPIRLSPQPVKGYLSCNPFFQTLRAPEQIFCEVPEDAAPATSQTPRKRGDLYHTDARPPVTPRRGYLALDCPGSFESRRKTV